VRQAIVFAGRLCRLNSFGFGLPQSENRTGWIPNEAQPAMPITSVTSFITSAPNDWLSESRVKVVHLNVSEPSRGTTRNLLHDSTAGAFSNLDHGIGTIGTAGFGTSSSCH